MNSLRDLVGALTLCYVFCLTMINAFPVGPQLQQQFLVGKLPNVTFDIGNQYAGNLPVQRGTNLSLFFWGAESKLGSLTAPAGTNNDPWNIWLNGGPGSSSLIGFFHENGPIRLNADYTASENPYSWDKQADTFWIDQPVGTGFSTLDDGETGWVVDEDQMASDFFGFLENLVTVFPNLATRPLNIIGESYAGTYIPYITKYYFGLQQPPIKLAKIAIGNGVLPNFYVFMFLPMLTAIETYPQMIGYDPDVYEYFKDQTRLCGYNIDLKYPETQKYPTITAPMGGIWATLGGSTTQLRYSTFLSTFKSRFHTKLAKTSVKFDKRKRELAQREWKRDLSSRANGTIDPWYGCDLMDYVVDYALNFTYPWSNNSLLGFDVYNIPSALDPPAFQESDFFLNDPDVKKAIHAPDKVWVDGVPYMFGGGPGDDPSPEPMVFLDQLAANATANNVSIIVYSGNSDLLVSHRGSEVAIQNTTFGGIQGFTRRPSTPWYDDNGEFAGIVHQERGWTYALFHGSGHLVPAQKPVAAWTFLREFILGNNTTGLVTDSNTPALGGEDPQYAVNTLAEGPEVYQGSYTTTSTYYFPSATVAVWDKYVQEGFTSNNSKSLAQAAANGVGSKTAGGVVLSALVSVIASSVFAFMWLL